MHGGICESSLAELEVVKMITSDTASDKKI